MSNEILKFCSPITEKYLVKAFNNCLEEGKIPQCMKIAKFIPLFKKRDRNNPENYLPMSLLSSGSKLVEKIVV